MTSAIFDLWFLSEFIPQSGDFSLIICIQMLSLCRARFSLTIRNYYTQNTCFSFSMNIHVHVYDEYIQTESKSWGTYTHSIYFENSFPLTFNYAYIFEKKSRHSKTLCFAFPAKFGRKLLFDKDVNERISLRIQSF